MYDYNLVLEHHGIPGQKHGVRNAEWYPISAWKAHLRREGKTSDKSHSTENLGDSIKRKYIANKVAKQKKANLKKARIAKEKAQTLAKEKAEIIRTGDVNKALSRLDDFSNEELEAIKTRNKAKIEIAKARTDSIMSRMTTLVDLTTKGINLYDNIAKIANTFGDTDLPIINGKSNKSQNDESKNQNNNKSNLNKISKDIEKRIKNIDKAAKKNAEKAQKQNEEPEHVSGTVEGEPKQSSKSSEKRETKDKDPVDTLWRDVTNEDIRKGEEYVQNILPKMDIPLLELKRK